MSIYMRYMAFMLSRGSGISTIAALQTAISDRAYERFSNSVYPAPSLMTAVPPPRVSRVPDNKLEKRNDAVVSGHQFFRNDTGAASRSVGRSVGRTDVHSPSSLVGGAGATTMISVRLRSPSPLFIKLPFA